MVSVFQKRPSLSVGSEQLELFAREVMPSFQASHYAAAECRHMTFEEHNALFNENGLYAGCRGWGQTDIQRASYPTP